MTSREQLPILLALPSHDRFRDQADLGQDVFGAAIELLSPPRREVDCPQFVREDDALRPPGAANRDFEASTLGLGGERYHQGQSGSDAVTAGRQAEASP